MNQAELARFIDRWTVEYVRVYAHPIDRVWRAITDPKEFRAWFIKGTIELRRGGAYRFESGDFAGEVIEIDAPRLIRFGEPNKPGYFQYELSEVAQGTRMRFVQHFAPGGPFTPVPDDLGGDLPGGPDTPWMPGFVGGWHEFWDALRDHLDGVPVGSRLPLTEFGALSASWVKGVQYGGGFTAKQAERAALTLRRKERWNELNKIYREHIRTTLPIHTGEREPDKVNAGRARFLDRSTIQYVRRYRHPVARVWQAITDPAEAVAWFMALRIDLRPGGAYAFGGETPDFIGTITAFDPPHRIRFGSDDGDWFQYELEAAGSGTRLVFTHHFASGPIEIPDTVGGTAGGIVGGWHEIFDSLGEWLAGMKIGARLGPSEFGAIASNWVQGLVRAGEINPATADRYLLDLRREEEASDLNKHYREQLRAMSASNGEVANGSGMV